MAALEAVPKITKILESACYKEEKSEIFDRIISVLKDLSNNTKNLEMLKNNSSFLDLLIQSSKLAISEDEMLENEGIIMNLLVADSDEIYKDSVTAHSAHNRTDSNSKYQSLFILMLLSFDSI